MAVELHCGEPVEHIGVADDIAVRRVRIVAPPGDPVDDDLMPRPFEAPSPSPSTPLGPGGTR